jgi:hypothetical protein
MRHACIGALISAIWFIATAIYGEEKEWSFEDNKVGDVNNDWEVAKTGDGPGSVWQVVADESAPSGSHAVAQMSLEGPRPIFNLCVARDSTHRDIDLSVSFKAVAGTIDQGGGPVWRYQDENNYYIARANPLEKNFRVYKVVDGKRTELDSADIEVPAGKWHALRVEHRGDDIRCFLNGKRLLEVQDSTFGKTGRVGLWTKADAVTFFDDLSVSDE